jgi:hypothetical protein
LEIVQELILVVFVERKGERLKRRAEGKGADRKSIQ